MNNYWKHAIWTQYGAAIDMLDNAISSCPDDLWSDTTRKPQYWHLAYHTLFFLDFYLTDAGDDFRPPAPFGLTELDPGGVMPERVYTEEELLTYLEFCRNKCREKVNAITDETAHQPCNCEWLDITSGELLLYNMRHVQHHAAQLNLIQRQVIDSSPRWVRAAKGGLLLK